MKKTGGLKTGGLKTGGGLKIGALRCCGGLKAGAGGGRGARGALVLHDKSSSSRPGQQAPNNCRAAASLRLYLSMTMCLKQHPPYMSAISWKLFSQSLSQFDEVHSETLNFIFVQNVAD